MLQNSFYAISGTFYTLLNNTDLYLSYFILSYVFLGHNDSVEWGLTVCLFWYLAHSQILGNSLYLDWNQNQLILSLWYKLYEQYQIRTEFLMLLKLILNYTLYNIVVKRNWFYQCFMQNMFYLFIVVLAIQTFEG